MWLRWAEIFSGRVFYFLVLTVLLFSVLLPFLFNPAAVHAEDFFTKLPNPAELPADNGHGIAFSHDSTYLVVTNTGNPSITIYKRNGDTFTKLPNPAVLPPAIQGNGAAFSHDDTYLAVAHAGSPFVTIYKRSGDTFTKLPDPVGGLPAGSGERVAFSHDSTYLAVAQMDSPYISIYKRSGDTFTRLPDPADLPANRAHDVAFSHDSTYLAVPHPGSPYLTIYKRSGDTFTKLPNPADPVPSEGYSAAFSYDSTYLAVGYVSSPWIIIYKRSGDTFIKLPNPAILPTGIPIGTDFNSSYLAFGHNTSPYLTIYRRSGDSFTKMPNPASLPAANVQDITLTQDAGYVAVPYVASPYVSIYKKITSPTVVFATTYATGTVVTIIFNTNMANPAGKHPEFSYKVNNGAAQSFSAATLNADNTRIDLTCVGAAIAFGNTITVSYTKGTVLAADGGILDSFTDQPVTNGVTQPTQQVAVATGGGTATFTTNAGSIVQLTAIAENTLPLAGKPGVNFPFGLFSFNVTGIPPGATVIVTITLPSPLPAGSQYWKFQNGVWLNMTPYLGSNDGDNVITLTLQDGGPGDADGVANGTIVDPGGPAASNMGISMSPAAHSSATSIAPPAPPVALPNLAVRSASLSAATVSPGTPVTITANIGNKSAVNGTKKVTLYVNGQVETVQGVTVNSGGSSQLTFDVARNEPGTYMVYVDNVPAGSFKVEDVRESDKILIFTFTMLGIAFILGIVMLVRRQRGSY